MTISSTTSKESDLLHDCRRYLGAAERLIQISAASVGSFFIETTRPQRFVGFLRDSLLDADALSPSTGGLSVAAYLFEIRPELSYVQSNILGADKFVPALRSNRDQSREFFLRTDNQTSIRKAFGTFNALTFSAAAYLGATDLAPEKWNERTALFNLINLGHFINEGWPCLDNVDKSHPYVAYSVLRAATEVIPEHCLSELSKYLEIPIVELFKRSSLKFLDLPEAKLVGEFENHVGRLRQETGDVRRMGKSLKLAFARFQEEAEKYLWNQISYAPAASGKMLDPLEYDPVGTCFALNILEQCSAARGSDVGVQRLVGEHGALVLRSIQHALEAISPNGTLPYGVPFSYDLRGTGAFATSVSGLAALARFLSRLLKKARKAGYPSTDFLTSLCRENAVGFQRLFSLAAIFEGSPRVCAIPADPSRGIENEKSLQGWWTDRAPSHKRVESWVTIEVFLFAVYLREFLQEYAQFAVLQKYAGIWPSEPVWPYPPSSNPPKGDVLRDPDEGDSDVSKSVRPNEAECEESSPIPFLHKHFSQFMKSQTLESRSTEWKQNVSSVLLYGPPGTSKTTTVRSLAWALEWHFLELTPSNFIIEGMELIEQRAKDIFDDLSLQRETVILFDELDSIFIDRERLEHGSIVNFLVPAMLPKLQALTKLAKRQRLLIVIATNFYDRLDPAMVRLGRIDRHLLVLPYNEQARLRFLREKCGADVDKYSSEILPATALYVYEELKELASTAKENSWFSGSGNLRAKVPLPAIGSTLYLSRIPDDDSKKLSRMRSTERLAVEVSEVVRRMRGQPRGGSRNQDSRVLIEQLTAFADDKTPETQDMEDWKTLCRRLSAALDARSAS